MEDDFLVQVLNLYKNQKWKEIIELNKVDNAVAARKLLWVWPSESNLQMMDSTIRQFSLYGVISIGCGCGLFEWLLGQFSGLTVIGYEVNQEWWSSRYSNPQFIKLNFPDQPPTPEILFPDYALLFCYFNDGKAFREYISCYKGNLVFIIGPGIGAGRHTDPQPFSPDFGSSDWILYKSQEVRDTGDFIAVYVRENY
ncbi:uncharacterized protein LOC103313644 [Tribolium castaneum]|uniref:uncharacterized protein LOC103313644 n=1 Tax=Tribolium castaneum TaxID=7070 RepID=UPI0000D56939|nr:PREDICTED: uncharacterized protein LOC103313644 [Tribolium castaneum]|eukprot:XP_008195688.1 PREDICTED: uncharacterized protein LOC103313644 [Tribolium castaneum]